MQLPPQGTKSPASKGKHKQQPNNTGGNKAAQSREKKGTKGNRQSKRKTRNKQKTTENRNKAKRKSRGGREALELTTAYIHVLRSMHVHTK